MSRDSSHTYLHLPSSRLVDLSDEFLRPSLPAPDLQIPPEHQPPNPEDEDDVVPDQHAAFGIQRATQNRREPVWRDLGVQELLAREDGSTAGLINGTGGGGAAAGASAGVNGVRNGSGVGTVTREVVRAALGARERAEATGIRDSGSRTGGGHMPANMGVNR